ncbi:MAG: hypothetical protein K8R25_00870, partial [Methanosarcinales archaeon]|nr:hypothetical protein [Methanosarcinales archaeon]
MTFDTIDDLLKIIGFIIVIALYLEKKPNLLKNTLINFFKTFHNMKDIIEWCKIFIKGFDGFYCEKNPFFIKIQIHIWAWIIISFIVTVTFGILDSYYGVYEINLALFAGLFIGTALFIFYILFNKDFVKDSEFKYLYKILVFLVIYPKCQNIYSVDEKDIEKKPIIKYIISSYIVALSFIVFITAMWIFAWITYPWLMEDSNFPIVELFNIYNHTNIILLIISFLFLFISIFYLIFFQYMVFYIVTKYRIFLKISPIRTIVISLLSMFIIYLLFDETRNSLFSDFNKYGWFLLLYLLLNIFADSFSILETRYIFQKAFSVNSIRSIFLLVLDIVASGFIFLIIPLSTGNLQVFLDALFFKGNSPWFGILFWSTFSTSIIFYIYILCFFCMMFLYKYSLIEKNIKEYPIYILGIILIVLTIFIYILKN